MLGCIIHCYHVFIVHVVEGAYSGCVMSSSLGHSPLLSRILDAIYHNSFESGHALVVLTQYLVQGTLVELYMTAEDQDTF